MEKQIRFILIVSGKDTDDAYLRDLIDSLNRMEYGEARVLFIDDASDEVPDYDMLRDLKFPAELVVNATTQGRAANLLNGMNYWAPSESTVCGFLDADDWLCDPQVFKKLERLYLAGWDCVYTNYQTNVGRVGGHSRYISPLRPTRHQGFRASHFFTFRSLLSAHVSEARLSVGGRPAMSATDLAVNTQVLEATIRRYYLDECPYVYRTDNPLSIHNTGEKFLSLSNMEQKKNAEFFLGLDPADLPVGADDRQFFVDHIDYFSESEGRELTLADLENRGF